MKGLSYVVMALLALNALWMLRDTTLVAHELSLLREVERGGFVSDAEVQRSNEARDGSGIGALLITLATIIVWLPWQYRGQRNLHRAGRPGLRFSAGWAVGWWFIPVASLWMPFQTVRELWFRSDPAEVRPDVRGWWVIAMWWAVWIVEVVAALVSASMVDLDDPMSVTTLDVIAQDSVLLVFNVAWILAAVLGAVIVRAVQLRQTSLIETPPLVPVRPDTGFGDRVGSGAPLPPG
jgi:hypothetical protein